MPQNKFGGRLRKCYKFWCSICSDRTVLRHIGGISIPFTSSVKQDFPAREIKMNEQERVFARKKIQELLDTGCITELESPREPGWISNIFLRPKKDGSYRLILNLKPLNKHIEYKKFKMPSIRNVIQMVKRNDFCISIDLREAYGHAAIISAHCPYLQFQFEGKNYMYTVLPNGISVGPRYFVQITKAIASYLRSKGVQIIIYIDDTLLIANSVEKLLKDRDLAIETFEKCGFTINYKKSQLIPVHELEFLGFVLNSTDMSITLTDSKREKLCTGLRKVLQFPNRKLTIKRLAQLIGQMIATLPACDEGFLHYRCLERFKILSLKRHGSWTAKIKLSHLCLSEMEWWYRTKQQGCPSKSIVPTKFDTPFYSDASKMAWGAVSLGANANGPFSFKQQSLSINTKELLAIYFGIFSLQDKLRNKNILCFCDNTTAVSTVLKKGSQHAIRDKITVRLFSLVASLGSSLTATHLAGSLNSTADGLSRKDYTNERLEWSLDALTMQFIRAHLNFTPNIDLFASHLNFKFKPYCSFKRDPGAMQVDAFTVDWSKWLPFAYPPFSILDRCLAKLDADKVRDLALVAPLWPTAPFFGTMLRHLKARPVLMPPDTAKRMFLPWDPTKRCKIKKLRLVLLHLCATCYAPRVCPPEWLNALQTVRGTRGYYAN